MKVLVLGASGMAGHVITLYFYKKGHDVTALSRRPFKYVKNIILDVREIERLRTTISSGNYDIVINSLGVLNHDAEQHKSNAVLINSFIPHLLAETVMNTKTRIIHMSTDCVFSGKKGGYTENDLRDGSTFYDRSKALGELQNDKDLTFRNSIIGPDINDNGIGLFNWFMKQKGVIKGYKNAIWSGVTTLELAKAIENAALQGITGLYHLTNGKPINKYELLVLFKKVFKKDNVEIVPFDNDPVDKSLVNSRTDFNYTVPDYEEMINDMATWIKDHKELYPHYFE